MRVDLSKSGCTVVEAHPGQDLALNASTDIVDTSELALFTPTGEMVHDGSPPGVMRMRIDALTRRLLSFPDSEKRALQVEHLIEDGMYLRKLYIPKGTLLVGKIHKQPCMNIVARGEISVLTEFGRARLQAGYSAISQRGTQKVGLAHEDTIFINVFRTDLTDLPSIEAVIAGEEHLDAISAEAKELVCL